MRPKVSIVAVAVFGLFVAGYLGLTPSLSRQHFDSLNFGYACEASGLRALWGNHPLGHLLQCGAFNVARRVGFNGRALTVFSVMNGVATAAAMAAYFLVMTVTVRAGLLRSLGWTLLLGGTYGTWHYAGTAEIYGMATLFLIVAWSAVVWSFELPSVGRSLLAGVTVGIATVTHQFDGVILAAAALGLLGLLGAHPRGRRLAALATLAGAAALVTIVGYAALGRLATGSASPENIIAWAVDHGHFPAYGRLFNLGEAVQGFASLGRTLWYVSIRRPPEAMLLACMAIGSALFLVSVLWIRHLPSRLQQIASSCSVACIVGWLLIVWWEPSNGELWLMTLPALVTWGEIALAAWKRQLFGESDVRRTRLLDVVPLLTGALLFWSTAHVLWVERQRDVTFEQALAAWVEHSGADDLLIESGGELTAHLMFWDGRPGTLNLAGIMLNSPNSVDRFATLRGLIGETMQRGDVVWFSPGLAPYLNDQRLAAVGVTRQQVLDFFDAYQREGPVFEYQAHVDSAVHPVYRLISP